VGCTIAIGLKHGKGLGCIPLDSTEKRDLAVAEVTGLYRDFIGHFGATRCSTLINCDFSEPGEYDRYHREQIYTDTCVRFFQHVMQRFIEADKQADGQQKQP